MAERGDAGKVWCLPPDYDESQWRSFLPPTLISDLENGRAVAYVGSGFTRAAAMPGWGDLLKGTANAASNPEDPNHIEGTAIPKQVAVSVESLLKQYAYEAAAQLIDDCFQDIQVRAQDSPHAGLGPAQEMANTPALVQYLQKVLVPKKYPLPEEMVERLGAVRRTNFKAIITTNFNPLLSGKTPFEPDPPYRSILRGDVDPRYCAGAERHYKIATGASSTGSGAAMEKRDDGFVYVKEGGEWQKTEKTEITQEDMGFTEAGCPIMQIHGNLVSGNICFTSEGYNSLLDTHPQYYNFMRALFLTHTMVYFGSSLSDHYINRLRSEAATTLGGGQQARSRNLGRGMATSIRQRDWFRGTAQHQHQEVEEVQPAPPACYIIKENVSPEQCEFYLRHEKVQILTYSTAEWHKAHPEHQNPENPDRHSAFAYGRPFTLYLKAMAAASGDRKSDGQWSTPWTNRSMAKADDR